MKRFQLTFNYVTFDNNLTQLNRKIINSSSLAIFEKQVINNYSSGAAVLSRSINVSTSICLYIHITTIQMTCSPPSYNRSMTKFGIFLYMYCMRTPRLKCTMWTSLNHIATYYDRGEHYPCWYRGTRHGKSYVVVYTQV